MHSPKPLRSCAPDGLGDALLWALPPFFLPWTSVLGSRPKALVWELRVLGSTHRGNALRSLAPCPGGIRRCYRGMS